MKSSIVFEKNVVEFVTVAAEYCIFLEQINGKERAQATDVLLKLLPLLYLKASMLPEEDSDETVVLSESVTEQDYDAVRADVASLLGSDDDYLEVFLEEMKYSDVPVRKTVSEDLADIYQPIKNFIESFRSGVNEIMTEAVVCCREQFVSYWGQTLTNTLRALHSLHYSQQDSYGEV
ncbi:MAG: DUF5063 domain-containing protein [Bacteroidaceae bacterium]|nr:DUF5063 domain-containing protein [Bacteroidaceae bacterium]